MLPPLTLVTGGAASGKSTYAEALVCATGRLRIYIATAEAYDDEMRGKLARHKAMRGPDWHTIEAPLKLGVALASAGPDDIVLLDCATMWLTNTLLAELDLDAATSALFGALDACAAQVVVVTNEVGGGIVPGNALSRRFREQQGRLNQQIAARAGLVVAVISGLPLALKGALPEGVA